MYMKVFPHGQGDGGSPTNYLVRQDYPGRNESPPEILRGDVETTRALIDSLDTVWKFTAGVLSWHPADTVTPEQEERVMDDFEAVAFAGLEPDQRNILWVRHNHARHHELHFVIPRVELASGKAFNPCPPGWQKHFDVFRDLHNHREQWARPDDPARARLHTPEHADLHTARLIRWGKTPNKDDRTVAKDAIHEYLQERIEHGTVTSRADVLTALQEVGLTINRAGKDYITVKDPDSGEKLRLKGGIYAEQWKFDHAGRAHQGQDRAGRQEIENLTRQQFESLSRSLSASSKTALSTTESVIHSNIAELEKNLTSRFQSLGQTFNRKYLYSILLSAGTLMMTVCTCWGLITLYRYQFTDLRQEIADLKNEKAAWDRDFPLIQRALSGLRLHQENGRNYLILPEKMTATNGGMLEKQEAWEIVRK